MINGSYGNIIQGVKTMDKKKIVHSVNKITSSTPLEKGGKIRINKMNTPEKITNKDGEKEATLNELSDDILEMLEDVEYGTSAPAGSAVMSDEPTYSRMTNQRRPPSYTGASGDSVRNVGDSISNMTVSSRPVANIDVAKIKSKSPANPRGRDRNSKVIDTSFGDGLDYGATHNESFTGTGAIGMSPGGYSVSGNTIDPKKKKKKKGLAGFTNVIAMDSVFSKYCAKNNIVEAAGFNAFLRNSGIATRFTESGLLKLMERNEEFLFHVGRNNGGKFWFTESLPE